LAEKVNLQFDEVAEVFSKETLESMLLAQIVAGSNTVASCGCAAQSGCTINNYVASCGCSSGSGGKSGDTSGPKTSGPSDAEIPL
jgi:hypothetical protein